LLLALKVKSVYGLWFLCSDFVYCLLFPQLVCALFDPRANRNGSMAAFAVSFVLRIGAGDATLGLPQWLPYPEGFPVKTVAMLAGLLVLPVVSRIFPREQTV
jgi:high affinity choline transporter 7